MRVPWAVKTARCSSSTSKIAHALAVICSSEQKGNCLSLQCKDDTFRFKQESIRRELNTLVTRSKNAALNEMAGTSAGRRTHGSGPRLQGSQRTFRVTALQTVQVSRSSMNQKHELVQHLQRLHCERQRFGSLLRCDLALVSGQPAWTMTS